MDQRQFLKSEYVETLRLLTEWGGREGSRLGNSTKEAFLIYVQHYRDAEPYNQEIFVVPDKKGIFLLCNVSGGRTFSNCRIVPAVVNELIEKWRAKGDLTIIEWPNNVDSIEVTRLERVYSSFGYWAVIRIPFQGLDAKSFSKILEKFSFETDDLDDKFGDLYGPF